MGLNIDGGQLARVCEEFDLDLVVLFGSHAKGIASPKSDYDIGVLPRKGVIPSEKVLELSYRLSRAVGVSEVDLVDLRRASPLLKHEVAESGHALFERDPGTFTRFRVLAFKMFQDAKHDLYRFLPQSIRRGLEKLRS